MVLQEAYGRGDSSALDSDSLHFTNTMAALYVTLYLTHPGRCGDLRVKGVSFYRGVDRWSLLGEGGSAGDGVLASLSEK